MSSKESAAQGACQNRAAWRLAPRGQSGYHRSMFTGDEIVQLFESLGITHVVWLPDSAVGPWESALEHSPRLRLVRVCREGEAWPLAAGLLIAGAAPLVVMQCTGLFESGDALRNVLFDLQLPLYGIIGWRNGSVPDSRDSAKHFTEPLLRAWGLNYVTLTTAADRNKLVDHYEACRSAQVPGLALLAEGPG